VVNFVDDEGKGMSSQKTMMQRKSKMNLFDYNLFPGEKVLKNANASQSLGPIRKKNDLLGGML
jgi:hypothetical protein